MTRLWTRPRIWRAFSILILALGAGWTWLSRVPGSDAGAGQVASPREGFPAPDFTLAALDGTPTTLSDHRGRVVIINLWASWCGPCRAEMPALQRVYEAKHDAGLDVLAVNSTFQDSEPDARAFVRDLGLTFPVLLDRDGAVSRRYLLRALPTTFFIDRRGLIRSVVIGGPMSETTIETKVEELLGERP